MRRVEGAAATSGPPFPMKRKYRFFFLANTTGARVLHRFSDPVTPWPSCQRSPAIQKRLWPPSNPHLASRRASRRRISGCGAFAFFLASEVSPKPVDKFLAETARRGRPEMAPQRLEKIKSAPGNGSSSEAWKPQHLVPGARADRALRPGAARTLSNSTRAGSPRGNFPPRKALKSLETEKEFGSLAGATNRQAIEPRRLSRAGAPLALTHAAPGLEPSPVEARKVA